MKCNWSNLGVLIFIATLFFRCSNSGKDIENNDSTLVQNIDSMPSFEYNEVLKRQENLKLDFSWPIKHELDLNDDGVNEEFQGIEGYSRGMGYALFSLENKDWKLISGDESIASGHLGINKLETKIDGWHDFVALQPSGRDGIIESYYTWNGKKYVLKEQKETEL